MDAAVDFSTPVSVDDSSCSRDKFDADGNRDALGGGVWEQGNKVGKMIRNIVREGNWGWRLILRSDGAR